MTEVIVVIRHPEKCFDEGLVEVIGVTDCTTNAIAMAKADALEYDGGMDIVVIEAPEIVEVYLGENAKKLDDEDDDNYYYYELVKTTFVDKKL